VDQEDHGRSGRTAVARPCIADSWLDQAGVDAPSLGVYRRRRATSQSSQLQSLPWRKRSRGFTVYKGRGGLACARRWRVTSRIFFHGHSRANCSAARASIEAAPVVADLIARELAGRSLEDKAVEEYTKVAQVTSCRR